MQNPRPGLRPSPGYGFCLPRPPAGGCIGDPRLARHRVRGGGSMSMTTLPKQRMKVPEFLAWANEQLDANYELVDGEVVAMAPERLRHILVKAAVYRSLDDAVKAAGLPCTVFPDGAGVVINDSTNRIPDASVQC